MQGNPPGSPATQADDNHLRLNPNDPQWQEQVANWQDGETYQFKDVEVLQISPGEYRVTKATPVEAAATEEGGGDAAAAAGGGASEEPNPAMRRLMAEQEA